MKLLCCSNHFIFTFCTKWFYGLYFRHVSLCCESNIRPTRNRATEDLFLKRSSWIKVRMDMGLLPILFQLNPQLGDRFASLITQRSSRCNPKSYLDWVWIVFTFHTCCQPNLGSGQGPWPEKAGFWADLRNFIFWKIPIWLFGNILFI